MKKLTLLAVVLFTALGANAQSIKEFGTHNFGVGPLAGYNVETESPAYGADLNYEYRPFEKWGFTAGLSYELTHTDVSGTLFMSGSETDTRPDHWNQNLYTSSVGARYYMGSLFLGAAFGLGFEKGVTTFKDGSKARSADRYGFYQNYSIGYQIPLANQNKFEFYGGVFGANAMKIGGGIRYRFSFK